MESDSQATATKSVSDQAVTASATTASVVADSSSNNTLTVAPIATDQSNVIATAAEDDGKKSPEPGSPDWVYADLPVSEVSIYVIIIIDDN